MSVSFATESEPLVSSGKFVSERLVGDWLLIFNSDRETISGRDAVSQPNLLETGSLGALSIYPTTTSWRGFPLTTVVEGRYQAWLLGEIFGTSRQVSSEHVLREVIRRESFAQELNGHFLLLTRDRITREWHLWTNRFGTVHAYYATDGRRTAVGTFSPAVAAAASQRQLDWLGLTGLFSLGFFPQDRTHFEDLRIVPPASHFTFSDDGALLARRRYWEWWHTVDERRNYDDTVAEFGRVFGEVMTDHLRSGRIAIPISGGLDSRTTVAAFNGDESSLDSKRFWSYSYGYGDDSIETTIARKVAAASQLPFKAFTIQPYLFSLLDRVSASVEGFQDVTQCRQAFVCEDLATHADYLIAAHWGDVWLDDAGLVGSGLNDRENIAAQVWQKMAKGGRQWLVENLCSSRLQREKPERLLRRLLEAELSRVDQIEDADFRIKAFKTDQWSFRWTTTSLRMFQPGAFPRLPFYDRRMTDFFCTVPTAFVSGRRLQIDYLKRNAEQLARIPWQTYDTNLFRYQYFNSWLLPKRALKKAWRIARGKPLIERNWEVQFLNESGRRGLIKRLLRSGLRLHEFVDPKAIRKLLDDFYSAPLEQKRGYTVSMLLTFSAWLEQYG
jgi:asparagine synthase (glutamine-hydrolysing)